MDKPKTMKETVDALWYAMIGTNGEGFGPRLKRLEQTCLDNHAVKKPRRIEALTVTIAVIVAVQSIGLLDGIKAALMQWLAGG